MYNNNIDDKLWKNYEVDSSNQKNNFPKNNLDKNAFLNLLVTQLKYQNPLNPIEDKEFLSQMAQFTTLEQMQNITKYNAKQQACSFIGKSVVANYFDESTSSYKNTEGLVSSVLFNNDEIFLKVKENLVPVERVLSVFDENI